MREQRAAVVAPPPRRAPLSFRAAVAALAATSSLVGSSALATTPMPGEPGVMPARAEDVATVLDKVESEDRKLAERLTGLATESTRVHALMVARGRSFVKLARAGLLPLGGGLDALVDHASRLERLRRSLARDVERERSIGEERVTLGKRREALADRRSVLAAERDALARSHTAILAAEEREAAFRRAFLGGPGPAPHTAVYGSGFGPLSPDELSGGFAGLRGRLPFPLEGRTEIRRGKSPGGGGAALEMLAAVGATVRAVYPGRVAFADTYAEYGPTVIVDHGGGYHSVTSNLSAIDVKTGDEVAAGDRLGAAGAVLRFEIRKSGETVNPSPWFGI